MSLLGFAVLGRLLIWALATSSLTERFWRLHPILTELAECDFCLGTWVYAALAWTFGFNILAPAYVPVASELVTGIAAAFVAHLARIGWQVKFGTTDLSEPH